MHETPPPPSALSSLLARMLDTLRRTFKFRFGRRPAPIRDAAELRTFLQTRSSYVSQYSLYGYLRTRAGTRYPSLFDNEAFVDSVNIAKWHVWLACLSDLAVYAGGLLRKLAHLPPADAGRLVQGLVDEILHETGTPADAGPGFGEHAGRVRARLALCDWASVQDDPTPFNESPAALLYWAPVVDDFKAVDGEIVQNSVRFCWQEIRRELRRDLVAHDVAESTPVHDRNKSDTARTPVE